MKTTTPKKSELSHSETEKSPTISDNNLKQLRSIFQNAPAAIAIFNGPQHRFIMANLKYQKQNNRTENDLLGKTYQEVYPELEGTGSFEIIDNVYKTGKTFTASEYEAKIDLNNNGVPTQYYFNFSLEALKNESDEIYGLMVMSYDVTEQVLANKKIEDSEQRFRLATEASGVGIWEWNVITNQIKWDAKMFEIYGVKPTNNGFVQYNTWKEAVVPEDFEEQEKILQDTLKNSSRSKRSFKILKRDDGILRHIEAVETVRTNTTGQAEWLIGTNIDVTKQVIARKKIEESEHKYENLIFTSPYMIAIFKGKNLIIEIANDAILETWGKGKDVIGKSFYDVLPEAVEQGFHKLILKVFETGEPYNAYETPITLWRNERWELMHYNFIYQAQRNMQGEIEGVAILANEVTPHVLDKMRIIESEERFRLLADNLPLSIFVAEPNIEANISYVNKYWLEYTKQTFEEAIGKGWNDIVHPDDVQLIMDVYIPAFTNRIPYSTPNIRIKRHDGVYRWFTFHGNPRFLNNGEFVGMIGAGFDITEQKLFELELIEEKIKADNAVQAKQQFLSNMSHEIRTPMNAIVGFTNVILKTELTDSQKQYLDAIKVSGEALVVLINDILDLAKVDSGKMTFDKIAFDLVESIHKIVQLFEIKLKEKKLKFNLTLDDAIPNQIIGDPMRLRQIILNLLSNAVKFTDKGSISLDVKVLSHSKNKLNIEFKITDTGIGIANEKLETIFNNFEQAHVETSANYGGTGLGLAIVKKLVENQGGTIVTNSEIGKGSTFSFTLKFNTNNLRHNLSKKTTENKMICQSDMELKNIKILVAEDILLNQLLIKVVLGNFNFEVEIAENGKIAIEKMKTNQFDLILMDLHMPEMNGFEATKHIREEMKSQIPIIALTADVTQADIDKCLAVGMNDYVSKPIDEKLLYEKIVKVINDNQK
ncbi:PAS domain S-box protein [Flavobacterium sp.]|uniref:PAS domain S-box protein n=1 Tax=Flavobacterium sp. TaxID=239 RepID=UPI00286EB25D|nr:PAS domain S-box protein [Flavobacterium sp.]